MNKKAKYYGYAEEHFVMASASLNHFSEREINQYVKILERYNFQERKKDAEPHSNSKRDHLKRKKGDNKTPIGLARATLRTMDPHYNANTANNVKNSLIEMIRDYYKNGPGGILLATSLGY